MFKKIITLAAAALIAVSALASCGEPKEPQAAEVSIDQLHTAIQNAYGEEYLANMPMDAEMLEATYGVKAEWCEEFVLDMPMMMTNVDTLIIVKPTEGNEENVVKALTDYHEYQKNDGFAYPKDLQKIAAAQIYSEGGYVFFIQLGVLSDELIMMEGTEEEIATAQYDAALANNQKAIVAVNALFFPEGK